MINQAVASGSVTSQELGSETILALLKVRP